MQRVKNTNIFSDRTWDWSAAVLVSIGCSVALRAAPRDRTARTMSAEQVGVTTCPVKAVKGWLQAARITEGPLFRPVAKGGRLGTERLTDQSVCKVVKAYAERLGLKAADFGAHSLRAVRFLDPCKRMRLPRVDSALSSQS
jgi:hypothetical protein